MRTGRLHPTTAFDAESLIGGTQLLTRWKAMALLTRVMVSDDPMTGHSLNLADRDEVIGSFVDGSGEVLLVSWAHDRPSAVVYFDHELGGEPLAADSSHDHEGGSGDVTAALASLFGLESATVRGTFLDGRWELIGELGQSVITALEAHLGRDPLGFVGLFEELFELRLSNSIVRRLFAGEPLDNEIAEELGIGLMELREAAKAVHYGIS